MDETKLRAKMNELYAKCSEQEGKYVINYSRYVWNGARRDDLWNPRTPSKAFGQPAKGTDGIQTQFNLGKSCVDTFTSKISSAATRPHFSTINGDYDSRKVAKELQRGCDIWMDEQHALPKSTMCLRDAAIFQLGVMHVNAETKSLEVVHPWEYNIDPVEYAAGALTRCQWYRKYFPLAHFKESLSNKKLKTLLDKDPQTQGEYTIYWDLYDGYKYELFDGEFIHDGIKLDYELYGGLYRRPFVEIFYTKPLKGLYSSSMMDDLFPIQKQLDALITRLDTATRNAVLGLVLTDADGGIKPSNIQNGYQIYSCPAEKQPVFIAPTPINAQYIELAKWYMDEAYNLIGIPKLDAQAKAPANLDSGKALDTMEDIASERFNMQLQQYVHFTVDCVRVAIDCFPKGDKIISSKIAGDSPTWGDARKARDKYQLQESAASILSKDPQEKANQVMTLQSMNLIDADTARENMNLPDLEGVYSSSGASYEHCQMIIQRAIEDYDLDYAETVNLNMLMKEAVKTLNMMYANGDNLKYIDRVSDLIIKVAADIKALGHYAKPQPPAAAFEPLREYALDAGQVVALSNLAKDVHSGALNVESAVAIATVSFPKVPPQSFAQMFEAPQPQGMPAGAPQPIPQGAING